MKTGERRQTKIEYFELELKLVTARPRKASKENEIGERQ
jgi:hypothetical protein